MEQAVCGVCMGPFVQPRVLPCGHSFCTNCLLTCIGHNSGRNRSFSCPLCKKCISATGQADINSFPRNFDLETLVDLLSKREAGDNAAQSSSPTALATRAGGSTSNQSTSAQPPGRRCHAPSKNTDDAEIRLAMQLSLAGSSGPQVDPETAQEDEDLARAIYFSQIDSNPSEASSSTQQIHTVNLKINNLHYTLTTDHLLAAFSPFGTIISAKVMTTQRGKSKGYGFVCYESHSAAKTAIREMDGHVLAGCTIKVHIARNSFV